MLKQREIIKRAALEAGKIILATKPTENVKEKAGRANLVTEADLKSENAIVELINQHFPEDLILSEETKSNIPNPLLAEKLWVVDPIDGTNNFRYERNYSCVSIAYAEKGVVQLGVVYDPFRDEMFYAEKMQGAFLNGKKIFVSKLKDLARSVVASDNSYESEGTKYNLELFLKLNPAPWFLIKGSATLTMCEVAAGRIDLYFHNYLKPWDNAAAFLIVEEAGGVVRGISGNNANFMSESVICGNEELVKNFVAGLGVAPSL